MTGYVRTDTTNNIADGNVISAADLDNEFNGVQAAFNSSTGHTHDGTASEGAPITKLGPVQDVTISTTVLGVKTTNTVDLGTSSLKFKDFYLAGNALIGGTLGVTGAVTFTAGTASTTTGTGTLVITGGLGVSGRINAANFDGIVGANTAAAGSFTTIGATGVLSVTASAVSTIGGFSATDAPTSMNLRLNRTAAQFNGIAFAGAVTYDRGIYLRPSSDTINIGRSTGGVFTDQLSVDESGNVGIGAASPSAKLNVSSTGNGNRALFDDTTNDNTLGIYSDSTDIRLLSLNNARGSYKRLGFQSNVIVFSASNGSESARIDTSGNLLVGTTSLPSGGGILTASSSAAETKVSINNTGTSGRHYWLGSTNTSSGSLGGGKFAIFDQTANAARLVIDSSGNVGIGTSSPTAGYMLDVTGKINTQDRYALNGKDTIAREDSNKNIIIGDLTGLANSYITFRTVNSDRVTIDTSGNLLVGTTTTPASPKAGNKQISIGGTIIDCAPVGGFDVSTSAIQISRASGVGGFSIITGYNTVSGAQGVWLVSFNASGGTSVVNAQNSTGLTVTFSLTAGALYMQTSSGTIKVFTQSTTSE